MLGPDIPQLVRTTLLESGCEEALIGDLDNHSTIALDFDSLPSILINSVEAGVWLRSPLIEYSEVVLQQRAHDILLKLMQGCHYAYTGQLQLSKEDGFLELRTMIRPNNLTDSRSFFDALAGFLQSAEQFRETLLK